MSRTSRRLAALSSTLAVLAAAFASQPGGSAAAAEPAEITRTVTYNGKSVTVRLHPVTLRAPGFEVLVQQADGTYDEYAAGAERAWLGSVDGDSAARASGIVRRDGVLWGTIVFDRGATWRFKDGTVYETRGLAAPAAYAWPSSTTAARNVSTSPGQAGTTTYRYDLGFDLAHDWFTHPGTINGSVANALDAVEFTAVSMLGLYESNALLRPAVGRVIVRADATKDPYAADTNALNAVGTEWKTNQADANVDNVVLQHTPTGGGGTAWVGTAGTPSGTSQNAGAGANPVVIRHEVAHNWGAYDNHTNGPEGATVESGNGYDRFDGTELSAIFRYRDSRQAQTAPFTPAGVFAEPLPPYAALDLVDDLDATVPFSLRPVANDHDANGDPLSLASVAATSKLGGSLVRDGDVVTYTPPSVTERTVDSAEYVVRDASGKTATGVMLFRVDPYVAPPAPGTWPAHPVTTGVAYELTNRQSALLAAAPAGATGSAALAQRAGGDDAARWVVRPLGSGVELKNKATGLCADVNGGSTADNATVLQYACHGGTNQQWKVVEHPSGSGQSLLNVRSGKCLAPRGASILANAELVQVTCGLSASQVWTVGLPPASTWPAVTPAETQARELVNVGSELHAGLPTTGTRLVQRAKGAGTSYDLLANGDGTWRVRNVSNGRCFDDEGGAHVYVTTWSCSATNANQRFRLLQHPAGGTALLAVGAGECLGVEGRSTASDALLVLEPCGDVATQRWEFEPTVEPPTFFASTTDVAIPDNNATGVTSPIVVERPGNAPATLEVAVDIVHPYVGDLVVELVAPDGTVYPLRSRTGGSADNITETYTVDASAEVASGTWRLRVTDRAALDTGHVNGWSLRF